MQLAWEKGLLKPSGLNYSVAEKRQPINNVVSHPSPYIHKGNLKKKRFFLQNGLKAKLKEFSRENLQWIERVDISVSSAEIKVDESTTGPPASSSAEDDDFDRELKLYGWL